MSQNVNVELFTRDLRGNDNPVLVAAAEASSTAGALPSSRDEGYEPRRSVRSFLGRRPAESSLR